MQIDTYLVEARASLRSQEDRFRDSESMTGVLMAAILALYGFSISAATSIESPMFVVQAAASASTVAVLATLFFASRALAVRDFDGAPMKWLGELLEGRSAPGQIVTLEDGRALLAKNPIS